MKFIAILLCASLLEPTIASAEVVPEGESLSGLGGLSMAYASFLVIASRFVTVTRVVEVSTIPNRIKVEVTTDKGKSGALDLPKDVVDEASIKQGDKLSLKPTRFGAVLAKNDVALAYVVSHD